MKEELVKDVCSSGRPHSTTLINRTTFRCSVLASSYLDLRSPLQEDVLLLDLTANSFDSTNADKSTKSCRDDQERIRRIMQDHLPCSRRLDAPACRPSTAPQLGDKTRASFLAWNARYLTIQWRLRANTLNLAKSLSDPALDSPTSSTVRTSYGQESETDGSESTISGVSFGTIDESLKSQISDANKVIEKWQQQWTERIESMTLYSDNKNTLCKKTEDREKGNCHNAAILKEKFTRSSSNNKPKHFLQKISNKYESSIIIMVCRSPSVQSAADRTSNALKAVEQLELAVKKRVDTYKTDFDNRTKYALKKAKISDATLMTMGIETKVEYANEFSIDAITTVINNAIKAYGAATSDTGGTESASITAAATSDSALESYVDLITSIGEAAKSSAQTASSFSFQMTRMGPGMFLFISATSVNLYDKDTFGTETVSATTFTYKIMRSVDDIKATTAFDNILIQAGMFKSAAEIDAESIEKWKKVQLGLIDQITGESGGITIEQYMEKDASIEKQVQDAMERLDNEHFATPLQPQGRLLQAGNQVHPSTTNAPHNFAPINLHHKEMTWRYDHEILQRLNHSHGQYHEAYQQEILSSSIKEQETKRAQQQFVTGSKSAPPLENKKPILIKKKLQGIAKATKVIRKRLNNNKAGGGNINDEVNPQQWESPATSYMKRDISYGSFEGTEGQEIYWKQYISYSFHVFFRKTITTEIRLGDPRNLIIGNIRTYFTLTGELMRNTNRISPGNLDILIPDELLMEEAVKVHRDYTNEHFPPSD
jgi:hypothetical protein